MTPIRKDTRWLKAFFWIALSVNLAHYAIFGVVIVERSGIVSSSDPVTWAYFATYLAVILYPGIFTVLGQLVIRDYFPDKEMVSWKRRVYHLLGVIQILVGLSVGAFGCYALFQLVPGRWSDYSANRQLLLSSVFATAMIASGLCNLVVALVVWWMIRAIRRNHRTTLLESFG